jgi:hypothetical protein
MAYKPLWYLLAGRGEFNFAAIDQTRYPNRFGRDPVKVFSLSTGLDQEGYMRGSIRA